MRESDATDGGMDILDNHGYQGSTWIEEEEEEDDDELLYFV